MTDFTFTWNSGFLALPANNELESLGAGRIRDHKAAFSERYQLCFSLLGDANDGLITFGQFLIQTADPIANAQPAIYTKANITSGQTELYYSDDDQHITQITYKGALNFSKLLPSGTRMAFLQAAVPTGWTHDTSINDRLVRINGSIGGGVGGSWTLNTDGHQLSTSELPSFNVSTTVPVTGSISAGSGGGIAAMFGDTSYGSTSVGGNQPHIHPINTAGTWRPQYTDAVVGVKT